MSSGVGGQQDEWTVCISRVLVKVLGRRQIRKYLCCVLGHITEVWMVITQIVSLLFWQLQQVVSPALVPDLILSHDQEQEDDSNNS